MHLSRWVQSHLSDEQFKNISLLPFRVTNKSGRTQAERKIHCLSPTQALSFQIKDCPEKYQYSVGSTPEIGKTL